MADTTWKAFERRIAKLFGGRRRSLDGERDGADIEAKAQEWAKIPVLYGQCKKGYKFPEYLREWLTGIVNWAYKKDPDSVPFVVWQSAHLNDKDSIVLMRVKDLMKLIGRNDVQGSSGCAEGEARRGPVDFHGRCPHCDECHACERARKTLSSDQSAGQCGNRTDEYRSAGERHRR